jgi:acetoin utilization protein AcuB
MLACEPVNRFMTEAVLSIDINSRAGEILRLFATYPVHHLPVVDNARVVGMLSSADVLKLQGLIPAHATNREDYLDQRVNVATLMRHPAIAVLASHTVEQAATLMASHGIHGLPVTDRDDRLLGIITTTDIMHAALHPERRGDEQDDSGSKTGPVCVSPAEFDGALHLAGAAAESNDDNAKIARALLYAQSRLKSLESVLACADHFLQTGQNERLHAALAKAIERVRNERGATLPVLGL